METIDELKNRIRALEAERINIQNKASKGIIGFIKTRVFSAPFRKLKKQFKRALVDLYMHRYYPECRYEFSAKSAHGNDIVRKTQLLGYDRCYEEDVIQGSLNDIQFYLSEISLKEDRREQYSNGQTKTEEHTVFDGMLFSIAFENYSFPRSRIKTKAGFMSSIFSKFENHEEYDFSYQTEDVYAFEEQLSPLFPFIEYLQKK